MVQYNKQERKLYGEDVFKAPFELIFEKCRDRGMIAGQTQAVVGEFLKANAGKTSLEIKLESSSVDEYLVENIKQTKHLATQLNKQGRG